MELYTEIAIGSPLNRGHIIKASELPSSLELVNTPTNKQELYVSYYKFDKNFPEFVKRTGSVKGYDGICYLSRILLDLDRGEDSDDVVLDKTREFVNDMTYGLDIPEEHIVPWYSGRGYHICIPNIFGFKADVDLPRVVKATLNHYLKGHDDIYDKTRLIRAPFTVNKKTNRMKIPLSMDEMFNLSSKQIIELATPKGFLKEELDGRKSIPTSANTQTKPLKILASARDIVRKEDRSYNRGAELSDEIVTPNQIAPCVQTMYSNGPRKGERRNVLLRIISYYRRNGLLHSAARAIAADWCSKGDGFDLNEANQVVDYIYFDDRKYTCLDSIMDNNCKQSCLYYQSKLKGNDPLIPVYTAKEMHEKYHTLIKDRKINPGINLKEQMGCPEDYWVRTKELVVFMGDSGCGKTAFLQNIITDSSRKTLWLCLEFKAELLFRRFRQQTESKLKDFVDESYSEDNPFEKDSYNQKLDLIKFCDVSPNITGLKRLVCEESPQVVVVDTIDCIKGNHFSGDLKSKLDETIVGLRDIAERQNIIVIAVSHIPKSESQRIKQTNGMLDQHSGMGSAGLAQKADHVWNIDQPNGDLRRFYVTKGRDNTKFEQQFNFDWKYMNFGNKDKVVQNSSLSF